MLQLPAPVAAPVGDPYSVDFQSARIPLGDQQLSLAAFLRHCAGSLDCDAGAASGYPALAHARDVFLRAGLAALSADARSSWYQIGVAPPVQRGPRTELYRRLAALADELLHGRAIDNFFIMHKPPGLRLRYEFGTDAEPVADRIRAAAAGWRRDGLALAVEPGVYEPENRLFGGPISMRYAHRVFTADSLAWLDFHATDPTGTGPDWALSLAMVRALFDALDIAGWEDIDVWDRIRDRTGRQLPPEAVEVDGLSDVGAEILACWQRPELLSQHLGPVGRRIAEEYRAAVAPIGRQWRTGYFATDAAYVGPRSVAAFVTIFHWNRAAMPMLRQALLAEALATREVTAR